MSDSDVDADDAPESAQAMGPKADAPVRTATIVQVSEAAGVSTATVSRCLNLPETVAVATLERVREKIRELGYVHPEPARRRGPRTVRKKPENQAVMFLWTGGESAAHSGTGQLLLHGMMSGMRRHGLTLIVDHLEREGKLPVAITAGGVDGVCLLGSEPSTEVSAVLRELPTVWVFQSGARGWGDRVKPDHRAVGIQAFEYLQERGATNLCVMTDPSFLPVSFSASRADAFVQQSELTDGVRCRVLKSSATSGAGSADGARSSEQFVRQFLKLRPRPDGLFITNQLGHQIGELLRHAGVALGQDLHVVVGDTEDVYFGPPLPMAQANILPEEVGSVAADMLVWRMKHPRAPRVSHLVEPRLVEPE
jgi:LacI family transcriptional regulator